MYKEDDFYADLIVCGSNCESLILEIAQQKDISCSLSGYDISFENLGDDKYSVPVKCINDGSLMKNHEEFVGQTGGYKAGLAEQADLAENGSKDIGEKSI